MYFCMYSEQDLASEYKISFGCLYTVFSSTGNPPSVGGTDCKRLMHLLYCCEHLRGFPVKLNTLYLIHDRFDSTATRRSISNDPLRRYIRANRPAEKVESPWRVHFTALAAKVTRSIVLTRSTSVVRFSVRYARSIGSIYGHYGNIRPAGRIQNNGRV